MESQPFTITNPCQVCGTRHPIGKLAHSVKTATFTSPVGVVFAVGEHIGHCGDNPECVAAASSATGFGDLKKNLKNP